MLLSLSPSRVPRRSRKTGFTLLELMVVFFITTLLGLVMAGIFSQSRAALGKATSRMDLVGRARRPVDRASFYISSAATNNGTEGVIYPLMAEVGLDPLDSATWPRHTVIQTTENFVDDAYTPLRQLEENGMGHYMFNAPDVFYYLMWFEGATGQDIYPEANNSLCMARLTNPGALTATELHTWAQDPFASIDSPATARYKVIASNIDDVAFRRVMENGLQMRVETRGLLVDASNQRGEEVFVQNSVIQIPALSFK